MAHRAAEPGIAARLRRPDAFDQAAQHQPVDRLQARFEQAEDAHPRLAFRRRRSCGRRWRRGTARHSRRRRRRARRLARSRRTRRQARAVMPPSAVDHFARGDAPIAAIGCVPGGSVSSGASAGLSCATSAAAASSSASVSDSRGSERCSDDVLPGAEFRQLARATSCSASASPAVPCFGRGPRRIARSSAAIAPSPRRSGTSGCLSSASSVTGASPPSAASAASRANTPAGVSASDIAAGIVDRHVPARQRGDHAARRARGRASPARRSCPGLRPLSRKATAMASASSSALAASITAMVVQRRVGVRRRTWRRAASLLPKLAGRRRPQRFGDERSRPCAAAGASVCDLVARACRCAQQRLPWRIADGRGARVVVSRRRPRSAPRSRRRDRCRGRAAPRAPCGSRAMVASSVAVAGIEPVEPAAITGPALLASRAASASISWSRRSAGSMRPRLVEHRRPVLADESSGN